METSFKTTSNSAGAPAGNKDLEKELEQMYVRTEHWISDSAFFEDELRFLGSLVDKYFVGLLVNNISLADRLRQTSETLIELDKERQASALENKANLTHIATILKNEVAFDPEEFRETQACLEWSQVGFLKKFRALKKEVFRLSEQLLRLRKNGRLITELPH